MFFTAIHQMMTENVDLTIVIRKANGQLTVATLPKSNGLKDEAQNQIVPLTVTGTPQELDAGFLQTVTRPIQKAGGLIANMAQFEAQADKAAANSKAAREAKSKESKEEREKREKYEKLMKKAEEMTTAKNYREALNLLGQAKSHANEAQLKGLGDITSSCPCPSFFVDFPAAVAGYCLSGRSVLSATVLSGSWSPRWSCPRCSRPPACGSRCLGRPAARCRDWCRNGTGDPFPG